MGVLSAIVAAFTEEIATAAQSTPTPSHFREEISITHAATRRLRLKVAFNQAKCAEKMETKPNSNRN